MGKHKKNNINAKSWLTSVKKKKHTMNDDFQWVKILTV